MSCNCTDYATIDVFVSEADTGIDLGLPAPVTGNYIVRIEFNGTWQQLTLNCTIGHNIILPNVLNYDYVHKIEIFKPDGDPLSSTCYKVHTYLVVCGPGNDLVPDTIKETMPCTIQVIIKTVPDPAHKYELCNGDTIPLEYPEGNTLTIAHLIGLYVNRPFVLDNSVDQSPNYDSTTGTWDNTANGGFIDGNKITINYAQPV